MKWHRLMFLTRSTCVLPIVVASVKGAGQVGGILLSDSSEAIPSVLWVSFSSCLCSQKPDKSNLPPHPTFTNTFWGYSIYAYVSQVVSFLHIHNRNLVGISFLSLACHIPRLSHHLRYGDPNSIWRGVQLMKLLIMQLSPFSWHSSLLGPNVPLSSLFSDTLICALPPLIIVIPKYTPSYVTDILSVPYICT